MQYLVIAYDGKDEEAMTRRLAVREQHLKGVEGMFREGKHLYGAAILDEKEKMIGSMMVVNFSTREELDQWLSEEPYVVGDVWKEIEIKPCKVAPTFMELYK